MANEIHHLPKRRNMKTTKELEKERTDNFRLGYEDCRKDVLGLIDEWAKRNCSFKTLNNTPGYKTRQSDLCPCRCCDINRELKSKIEGDS